MTRRLRRIAVTQAVMIKRRGMATTAPNHGFSFLSMRPTEMGVIRKKFNTSGCGLHDDWAKRGVFCGIKE